MRDYCQRTTASWSCRSTSSLKEMECDWKLRIKLGRKALGLKATVADVLHYCQLPKELENRVNDFNNLHNAVFEFLVLRQGRASAWPVGKLAVARYRWSHSSPGTSLHASC